MLMSPVSCHFSRREGNKCLRTQDRALTTDQSDNPTHTQLREFMSLIDLLTGAWVTVTVRAGLTPAEQLPHWKALPQHG